MVRKWRFHAGFRDYVPRCRHEFALLAAPIVRTHRQSAGAQKKTARIAIGRSRAGLMTKIHAAVDARGNPAHGKLGQLRSRSAGVRLCVVLRLN
jgi:hypothetical protein